jgi:hypothetical protein
MELLINISLVIFTAFLAWATFKLAQYTKVLANHTDVLVRIEQGRDKKEEREKRIFEIRSALQSAETIQKIFPSNFANHLNKPSLYPAQDVNAVENLHSLKMYIEDPDTQQSLDRLCNVFDSARRDKQKELDESQIAKDITTVQNRMQWSINQWRDEISSARQPGAQARLVQKIESREA